MNENIRFIEVLNLLKEQGLIADYVQAAKMLETNKAGISDIKSGRKKLSIELIRRLKSSYPTVSIEWIIMGNGEPFINHTEKGESASSPVTDALIKKIGEQGEEIGRLQERIKQLERQKGKSASGAQTSGLASAG